MNAPLTVVTLAGSVALLLCGVRMVQTGVQRAFGAKLRSTLGQAPENRLKAFLAGAGVTAILQSGTATGLMITGFAAGGLVERLRSGRRHGRDKRAAPGRAPTPQGCQRASGRWCGVPGPGEQG